MELGFSPCQPGSVTELDLRNQWFAGFPSCCFLKQETVFAHPVSKVLCGGGVGNWDTRSVKRSSGALVELG
jgi:hypothetical protein